LLLVLKRTRAFDSAKMLPEGRGAHMDARSQRVHLHRQGKVFPKPGNRLENLLAGRTV
jgi:hypothetical protein